MRQQFVEQGVIQRLFPAQCAFAGTEYLVLEGLEFGGDKPLGTLEGLAAAVIIGHVFRMQT